MEINSDFIRNKEFHIVFKGYKPEEVDEFLDVLTIEFDRLIKKNKELQENLERLKFEGQNEDEDIKKIIQDALISAHKVAEEIKNKAKLEAEEYLEQQKLQGEKSLEELKETKKNLEERIVFLQQKFEEFKNKINNILKDFSSYIESGKLEINFQEIDSLLENQDFEKRLNNKLDDNESDENKNAGENLKEENVGGNENYFEEKNQNSIENKPSNDLDDNLTENVQLKEEDSQVDLKNKNSSLNSNNNKNNINNDDRIGFKSQNSYYFDSNISKNEKITQYISRNLETKNYKDEKDVKYLGDFRNADGQNFEIENQSDLKDIDNIKKEKKRIDIANPDIIEDFFRSAD